MADFYYGGGDCSVQGNVSSLTINYRGAIVIENKLPDSYVINLEAGKLVIEALSNPQYLSELFTYLGYFKVLSVTAYNLEGDRKSISIKRVMDYAELLTTNAEDLTVKSEDLKVTYIQGRTFNKTVVLQPHLENLTTEHDNYYLQDGSTYSGSFHVHHGSGRYMTGRTHTEESLDLYFKDIEELILYSYENIKQTRTHRTQGKKVRRRR